MLFLKIINFVERKSVTPEGLYSILPLHGSSFATFFCCIRFYPSFKTEAESQRSLNDNFPLFFNHHFLCFFFFLLQQAAQALAESVLSAALAASSDSSGAPELSVVLRDTASDLATIVETLTLDENNATRSNCK